MQDEEKDLFIRKKLREDELVSKKYDDVFENFLKGEHEMKKESRMEAKVEKQKVPKNRWVKSVAAVAACALIFTGANVYATTQGYDNIFFLIKDLGNKNKQVTATKDEILVDRDVTISYTNIEIAEGLSVQINKFTVKDGNASLFISVNQSGASMKPAKFIVTSDGTKLAENTALDQDQYSYEIRLSNYQEKMKVLELRIEDNSKAEIVTIQIDLENREIDLVANEEIKKISEIDLKEKLGNYAIALMNNKEYDDYKFFLGSSLISKTEEKVSDDGYLYYPKDKMNQALMEAIGEELGTNINSEIFEYNKNLEAYKYITTLDGIRNGLCLNIDDLKYENGKYVVTFTYCLPNDLDYEEGVIESLEKYQTTLEFVLNENETYTKYRILNIENAVVKELGKPVNNQDASTNNNHQNTSNSNNSNIESKILGVWHAVAAYDDKGELVSLTSIFGSGVSISNKLTIKENGVAVYGIGIQGEYTSGTYEIMDGRIYLTQGETHLIDYNPEADILNEVYKGLDKTYYIDLVRGEYVPSEVPTAPDLTKETNETVDNYASTMSWSEYAASGLRFQYPTAWELTNLAPNAWDGGVNSGVMTTRIEGIARGINKDTNEIVDSEITIHIQEPDMVNGMTREEYVNSKIFGTVENVENLTRYNTNDSGTWYCVSEEMEGGGYVKIESYFNFDYTNDGTMICRYIEIQNTNPTPNWKVVNITNWFLGSIKLTSF
ncbi:MAG: hypothetical protein IJ867_07435 [Clostridia bacterium]|nr:hypothetical protein [Clostridia bacterium]